MFKNVTASDAKNNFGGLLEDVAALGRVNIMKHGRLVAVMLSPRALESLAAAATAEARDRQWGATHMIPADLARQALPLNQSSTFDED